MQQMTLKTQQKIIHIRVWYLEGVELIDLVRLCLEGPNDSQAPDGVAEVGYDGAASCKRVQITVEIH